VQQSQLSTLQTENNLATAQLTAPFAGVISSVVVKPGELYAAGPAIGMADLESFHMDVFVDEVDVRDVAVGQSVLLRIDAFPDKEFPGVVTEVSPVSQNIGGTTAYAVKIVPDATEMPLRAGMSATAVITIDQIDGAILVPNRYITLNRETGEATVFKMVDGAPAVQQIELGLRNEAESQVLAGLDEGDEVVLITTSGVEQLMNVFQGN
jgi:HlyD family secretion protein